MIARIQPALLHGTVSVPPSKSEAHRALICAALSDAPTAIVLRGTSDDIEATLRGLTALGARITRSGDVLTVEPVCEPADDCAINVGESGTTLRLLLPLAGALGCNARFVLCGLLPHRPITPLTDALRQGGCAVEQSAPNEILISGKLHSDEYTLPGNVSSQFVSGMLIALSLLIGESRLRIENALESAGYVRMTMKTLADFGASVSECADGFRICGRPRLVSPKNVRIGGDWSAAAFWLCADALSSEIDVRGLDSESAQPDRRIAEILRGVPSVFDASANPDLVPPLTAFYSALGKELRVTHAERLRLKESDRLSALADMVCAMGGRAEACSDGLCVTGGVPLTGGSVNPRGDHRIAMAAAVAAIRCMKPVEIHDAECVSKSYPDFWTDYVRLGGQVQFIQEA